MNAKDIEYLVEVKIAAYELVRQSAALQSSIDALLDMNDIIVRRDQFGYNWKIAERVKGE